MVSGYVYCSKCGMKNNAQDKFCAHCGAPLVKSDDGQKSNGGELGNMAKNAFSLFLPKYKVSFKKIFSTVFDHHSEEEADTLFSVGAPKTTPRLSEVRIQDARPWLFARVLLSFLVELVLIFTITRMQPALKDDMFTVLAFSTPVTVVVLFFELNVFRDNSAYSLFEITLTGGLVSILATLILSYLEGYDNSLGNVLLVGFIEETTKGLVCFYFIKKRNIKSILGGLSIGSAVGAGFAAFENLSYIGGSEEESKIIVAFVRCIYSIGTHAIWTAIVGGAIVLATRNSKISLTNVLNSKLFWTYYLIAILLHAFWDWDLLASIFNQIGLSSMHPILLIILGYIIVFRLTDLGMRQVRQIHDYFSKMNLGKAESDHEMS